MKILIVEDDIQLSGAIKAGLEEAGYAADVVNDGEAAQRRIEANHAAYDAVVLDVGLPKKDGLEVCKEIRAKGIKTPVLILTGKDKTQEKVAGLDVGADDYLTKPFSQQELEARIRALLRRPTEVVPGTIHVGDITLDTATRKVQKGLRDIRLTLKEFALLEYLMRHAGQVVNREQLLDHVWDFNFNSFSNVVDVHMNNLRKKLGGGKRDEHGIETIRGIGYRLSGT
jgi:DNA-binding response OmpR family regulator